MWVSVVGLEGVFGGDEDVDGRGGWEGGVQRILWGVGVVGVSMVYGEVEGDEMTWDMEGPSEWGREASESCLSGEPRRVVHFIVGDEVVKVGGWGGVGWSGPVGVWWEFIVCNGVGSDNTKHGIDYD